ncbi:hypothetical protein M378DRAFT_944515 [Amanita muscaria Koide BX008]|uniref:Uncharacterized protein n=1 Tax=Amanita muscaria (strain Koide BX008) TaxID=946122 RepID=A0A0C2SXN1_AMAMK|nr:hypothetical protein M378DRAFT_944515 [Amanita muscaria Koide BX008]
MGKKSKLVKEKPAKEREVNSKSVNEESVSIVRQPPSPIPEEAENAFVVGAHEEPGQNDYWSVGSKLANAAPAQGGQWYASPRQSGAASPRTGDYGPQSWAGKSDRQGGQWYASPRQSGAASPRTGDHGPHSWAGKSDSSSMSRDPPRRPSSPYPINGSVDLDQDDARSTGEGELDYVSERSGPITSTTAPTPANTTRTVTETTTHWSIVQYICQVIL